MNTTKKVVLASACGAAIGYAVASQLLHGWLFVGIIVGAIAGWFLYDPAQFFVSVKGAVKVACENTSGALVSMWMEDWKPIRSLMWKQAVSLFVLCQFASTILMYILLVHAYVGGWSARLCIPYITVAVSLLVVLYGIIMGNLVIDLFDKVGRDHIRQGREKGVTLDNPWKFFLMTNVLVLWLITIVYLAKGLNVLLGWFPTIARFSRLVVLMTFQLAHSNGRLASAVGGALGALVGLWTGHLIVAMLVGAIAGGIAHYLGQFCSEEYVGKLKANLTGNKSNA